MQSCFHLDLALKLKGINIAMGGGAEGALRLLFRFGNRVLGGRGEISTECLNLFATVLVVVYKWLAYQLTSYPNLTFLCVKTCKLWLNNKCKLYTFK